MLFCRSETDEVKKQTCGDMVDTVDEVGREIRQEVGREETVRSGRKLQKSSVETFVRK